MSLIFMEIQVSAQSGGTYALRNHWMTSKSHLLIHYTLLLFRKLSLTLSLMTIYVSLWLLGISCITKFQNRHPKGDIYCHKETRQYLKHSNSWWKQNRPRPDSSYLSCLIWVYSFLQMHGKLTVWENWVKQFPKIIISWFIGVGNWGNYYIQETEMENFRFLMGWILMLSVPNLFSISIPLHVGRK